MSQNVLDKMIDGMLHARRHTQSERAESVLMSYAIIASGGYDAMCFLFHN